MAVVPVGQVVVELCFWQSSFSIVEVRVLWSVGMSALTSAFFTGLQSPIAPRAHPQRFSRQQRVPEQPASLQTLSAFSTSVVAVLVSMTLLILSAV